VAVNKSKLKGSTFELKVAKIFTEHFGIKFERVPHSGALPYLKGDIWAPKYLVDWQYCVECKHYKEVTMKNMLWAKSNDILAFWDQAVEETKVMNKELNMNKLPIVVFRWDRGKEMVVWNDEIEVEHQFTYRGFGYQFKIAELEKWLPKVKLK